MEFFGKSQKAKEETNEKAATEIMNLKITNAQIEIYTKEQRMPTLKELATLLDPEKDKDIQSIAKTRQKVSALDWINDTDYSSIFTILKEYPEYEFEIDSKLKLATINGVKVADNSESEEIKKLTERIEKLERLQVSNKSVLKERPFGEATMTMLGNNTQEVIEEVSLSGYGKGKAIISFSCDTNGIKVSYLTTYICKNSSYAGFGETMCMGTPSALGASTSASISYDENTTIQFKASTDVSFKPYYLYSILLIPEE